MARRGFIPSYEHPYHITGRAHNRAPYPIPLNDVWKIMSDELWLAHHLYNLRIHAFVLMPNHFHLIASTPEANLSSAMHAFMSHTSRAINKKAGKINQNYGSRYFRTLIEGLNHFFITYKYLYRNPVKACLTDRVEGYPYSTIQSFLGLQPIDIPIERDEYLMMNIDDELTWLNTAPTSEQWDKVRNAMKKQKFSFGNIRESRRKIQITKETF